MTNVLVLRVRNKTSFLQMSKQNNSDKSNIINDQPHIIINMSKKKKNVIEVNRTQKFYNTSIPQACWQWLRIFIWYKNNNRIGITTTLYILLETSFVAPFFKTRCNQMTTPSTHINEEIIWGEPNLQNF